MSSITIKNICPEKINVEGYEVAPDATRVLPISQRDNISIIRITGTYLGILSGGLFGLERTFYQATYRGLDPDRVSRLVVGESGIWEDGELIEGWIDISPGRTVTAPGIG